MTGSSWLYDVFVSHASEDKEMFVRPLAHALKELHVEVWYDEFTLRLGDSLRRSIDLGLSRSRFAVVVLSPDFFAKNWPQRELDGLVAREMDGGQRVILPVWHRVTRKDVLEFSPPLADVLAIDSSAGVHEVAKKISEVARPRRSPLVVARDLLLEKGLNPPVVTDEWWLDIVESSNMEYPWGYRPHRGHWGRWSFWLPGDDGDPNTRGERLAMTAMQVAWTAEADARRITQITPPEEVLDFIRSQPGLADTCHDQPRMLANYAPQLIIPGFGGDFEEDFDWLLEQSVKQSDESRRRSPQSGTALTTDGTGPRCEVEIALRHPTFGNYEPSMIACQFVQGEMAGPPVHYYPTFDYVAWALSEKSCWLPERIRKILVEGLAGWTTWYWDKFLKPEDEECNHREYPERGALFLEMFKAAGSPEPYSPSPKAMDDLTKRCDDARRLLDLEEPADELAARFLRAGFVDEFLEDRRRVQAMHTKENG